MKYLILCLLCFQTSLMALENFDLDILEEFVHSDVSKMIEKNRENLDKSLKLNEKRLYFKGQKKSGIDWANISSQDWLNFNAWVKERELKDNSDARLNETVNTTYTELVGSVIKCVGFCYKYEGVDRIKAEFMTRLHEGDEFVTGEDSYSWIFLMDGSLLRLSPKTSVTLQEINFTATGQLFILRLNRGFVSYVQRSSRPVDYVEKEETDVLFSPLMFTHANREYYMMKTFRNLDEKDKLNYTLGKAPGAIEQYQYLNSLIRKNNEFLKSRKTQFVLYSPNFTVEGEHASVNLFYEPNFKGYISLFPLGQEGEGANVVVGKRGYNQTETINLDWNKWYTVDAKGEEISETEVDHLKYLRVTLSYLERIPSVLIAREALIDKKLKTMLQAEFSLEEMAKNFGYRLWNVIGPDEDKKRLNFVREYVRRVETTNLKTLGKLIKKEEIGMTKDYIQKAFNAYYFRLKRKYHADFQKIYYFSDTQYYLWMLRNGK